MSSFDPEAAEQRSYPTQEESPKPPPRQLSDTQWGQAARAVVLFILIGMALAMTVRLGFGREWIYEFLKKNDIEMHDRLLLIAQMSAVGIVLGLSSLVVMVLPKTRHVCTPQTMESWAWFLSPLILLPAPIVILQHEIWDNQRKDLLGLILFGGILAEFLFSRALSQTAPRSTLDIGRFFTRKQKPVTASPEDGQVPQTKTDAKASFFVRPFLYLKDNPALLVVILSGLAYGAFMSFFTVRWHHKLGTAIFDLGINNNLLFGGLHGHFNESSVIFPEDPQKYLANHVKWGIYFFLPIYALAPRAETLLIIQSVSLGLGAIPLYLFCKDRLPAWWAAAIALCYLAYYPLHGANFYEMKLVPTAAAFVLLCVWLIDTKRYLLGGAVFLLTMIMREDLPVPLAVVGAVFLLSGRRPLAGLMMTSVAATWFVFLRFRFMNDVGSWWFPNMYKDLWAAPERGFQGVVKTLLSNPSFTLKHIFVERKFWYLMHLMVPLMFLPVRRWYGWAALVPGAILTLLVTDYNPPLMYSFQYVMHWAPYLFLAGALILAAKLNEPAGRPRALGALIAMCLTSAGLSYNYGAFPLREKALRSGYHKIEFQFDQEERARYRDVQALLRTIPDTASVAATEHIGAHLSSRVDFFTLRRGSHDADYLVARKKELSLGKTRRSIYRALKGGEYGVSGRFGDFIVFKKGAPTQDNDAVIDEWELKSKKRNSKRSTSKTSRPSTLEPNPAGISHSNDDSEDGDGDDSQDDGHDSEDDGDDDDDDDDHGGEGE